MRSGVTTTHAATFTNNSRRFELRQRHGCADASIIGLWSRQLLFLVARTYLNQHKLAHPLLPTATWPSQRSTKIRQATPTQKKVSTPHQRQRSTDFTAMSGLRQSDWLLQRNFSVYCSAPRNKFWKVLVIFGRRGMRLLLKEWMK
jgi:hypothetical protein